MKKRPFKYIAITSHFELIIEKINKFYAKKNISQALFVVSVCGAQQISCRATKINFYKLKLNTFYFNCLEYVKAVIKHRLPVYRTINNVVLSYCANTTINFVNGTAVVIQKDSVDKFYFKDLEYFIFIYQQVSSLLNIKAYGFYDYLLIRQPKYQGLKTVISDADAFSLIENTSTALGSCILHSQSHNFFTVQYKVQHYFKLYPNSKNNMELYLDVCAIIDRRTASFHKQLCHGDVWIENILRDNSGNLMLIDFDKIVYFCAVYDYIYYYIMSKIIHRNTSLQDILINIDEYARAVKLFLVSQVGAHFAMCEILEVKCCIFLFVFLKLLECDLHQNQREKHIFLLRDSINKL